MIRALAVLLALVAPAHVAGAQSLQLNVVQESLDLKPADIVSAEAVQQHGQWAVAIKLAPGAGAMFGAITGRNIRKRMQIVIEDRIVSAPVIMQAITQGDVLISGNFTEDEARALAAKIRR